MIKECQHCGLQKLVFTDAAANGAYGPSFLPGTGVFRSGKFRIIICQDCGFVHWFVSPDDLEKIKESKHFQAVR